MKGKHWKI